MQLQWRYVLPSQLWRTTFRRWRLARTTTTPTRLYLGVLFRDDAAHYVEDRAGVGASQEAPHAALRLDRSAASKTAGCACLAWSVLSKKQIPSPVGAQMAIMKHVAETQAAQMCLPKRGIRAGRGGQDQGRGSAPNGALPVAPRTPQWVLRTGPPRGSARCGTQAGTVLYHLLGMGAADGAGADVARSEGHFLDDRRLDITSGPVDTSEDAMEQDGDGEENVEAGEGFEASVAPNRAISKEGGDDETGLDATSGKDSASLEMEEHGEAARGW